MSTNTSKPKLSFEHLKKDTDGAYTAYRNGCCIAYIFFEDDTRSPYAEARLACRFAISHLSFDSRGAITQESFDQLLANEHKPWFDPALHVKKLEKEEDLLALDRSNCPCRRGWMTDDVDSLVACLNGALKCWLQAGDGLRYYGAETLLKDSFALPSWLTFDGAGRLTPASLEKIKALLPKPAPAPLTYHDEDFGGTITFKEVTEHRPPKKGEWYVCACGACQTVFKATYDIPVRTTILTPDFIDFDETPLWQPKVAKKPMQKRGVWVPVGQSVGYGAYWYGTFCGERKVWFTHPHPQETGGFLLTPEEEPEKWEPHDGEYLWFLDMCREDSLRAYTYEDGDSPYLHFKTKEDAESTLALIKKHRTEILGYKL